MQLVFETTQGAFPEEHVEELEGDDGGESPDSVGLGFVQRERVPSTAAPTSTAYSELGETAGVLKKSNPNRNDCTRKSAKIMHISSKSFLITRKKEYNDRPPHLLDWSWSI